MFDTDVKTDDTSGGFDELDDDALAGEVARLAAQLAAGGKSVV